MIPQTITKVQTRNDFTKTGKIIPVYKVSKFKPGHPEYEKEVALRKEFLDKQEEKRKVIRVT